MKTILTLLVLTLSTSIWSQKTIAFPSKDGLDITADLYITEGADTFILLFHQAGWSRGEYNEIAPRLNKLGYNSIAIDQRSGGGVNSVKNQTHIQAKKKKKPTTYIDAFQDIEATVAYIKETYTPKKIIIWGSSYSSSLVLKYAGDNPDAIQGVLSFSPGEYFGDKTLITQSAKNITVPAFITSSRSEKRNWSGIYDVIPSKTKQAFIPNGSGNHGSRALWEKNADHQEYWDAVTAFLETI